MAGFVYYLPDKKTNITADAIRAAGLGYAFEEKLDGTLRMTVRQVSRGPSGEHAGVVVGDPFRIAPGRIGFYPAEQEWRQLPQSTAWVGYYRDDPPRPDQLWRKEVLPGHAVELGDGQKWEVPIVRGITEVDGAITPYTPLPRRVDLNEEGAFVPGDVLPCYEGILRGVLTHYDRLVQAYAKQESKVFCDDQVAAELLTTNYCIGRVEIVVLGLFTWNSHHIMDVLNAAIDLPGFEELQKKVEAGGSSIDVGLPADAPSTDPA